MSEEKKNQKRPINQKKVEEMLERGESFEGLEIGDIQFSAHQFENHVNFYKANFVGSVDFYFTKFLKGADFLGAKFLGENSANFGQAEFSGEESASFTEATFSGKEGAIFTHAKFLGIGGANFTRATFSGEKGANFFGTEFLGIGEANFRNAMFLGEGVADFRNTKFSGKGGVSFNSALFSTTKGAKFTGAEFLCEGRISFEDVKFEKDCTIHFDNVKVKYPKNIYFWNNFLGNTTFYETDVEDFSFKNVEFRKFPDDQLKWFNKIISIHREGLVDEIWNEVVSEENQLEYDEAYFPQVEIIYRQLKRNFEDKRDYARAGDFHYGEMEMKRLQKSKFKQYISLTAFYKYFSGYGQKWFRAFSWFTGFVVLFMFLNLKFLVPKEKLKIETINNSKISVEALYVPPTNIDAFIYTFNTMTLREDRRFEITDSISSLFVIFQSAIGPTLLALMFLAIRRQFRR